jgi:hypothetical protein
MKTIQSVSIWDNGQTQEATVLNAYAVNVSLGNSAILYYLNQCNNWHKVT